MSEPCILKFKTLTQAIDFANKSADHGNGASILHEVSDWTNNYGFDEYVHDFYNLSNKNKNSDAINKAMKILESIINTHRDHFIPQNIFTEYYDNCGSSVDISKYINNDPECMINFGDNTQKKAVNIFFQIGGTVSDSDKIEKIGIIIYCLNKILKNKTIGLYGINSSETDLYYMIPIILPLQDTITPQIELVLLNLKAFFRRICFAIMESLPDPIRDKIGIWNRGGGKKDAYGNFIPVTKTQIIKYFGITPDILLTKEFFKDGESLETSCKKVVDLIIQGSKEKG